MDDLLTGLLAAGLIPKLDGDDARFQKIQQAAKSLSQAFSKDPKRLIPAVLAGLNPEVSADDPSVQAAEQALTSEWKAVRSVFPDPPVGLLRAILLSACQQAASEERAAIVWLTAADTLPWMRLGREEAVVREALLRIARDVEAKALKQPARKRRQKVAAPSLPAAPSAETVRAKRLDRESLTLRVARTAGPQYRAQNLGGNVVSNRFVPGNNHNWVNEFSDRMSSLLADLIDETNADSAAHFNALLTQLNKVLAAQGETLASTMNSQQSWVSSAIKAAEERQQADLLRVDALWWSEALFSESALCSYRDLQAPLAAVLMSLDLLTLGSTPSPASVCHLLAETVNRLPKASYDEALKLMDVLKLLREQRQQLPKSLLDALTLPAEEGALSIRDVMVSALRGVDWTPEQTLARAGLEGDVAMSLPALARAMFRQEQAVRLAWGNT